MMGAAQTLACIAACALTLSGAPYDKHLIDTVWTALNADPGLVRHHRGYLAYLDTHPGVASSEEAYGDLAALSGFRQVAGQFDEALNREPDMQRLFDRFIEAVAQNDALRHSVDSILRLAFGQGGLLKKEPEAFAYLLGHPGQALEFLEEPSRLRASPAELEPLVVYFKERPEIRERLLGHLENLHEQAAAHTYVFPWWRAVADSTKESGRAYARLVEQLADHPPRFWVWYRRAIALAAAPRARDWIQYWGRRVRRDPILARDYRAYLRVLRDHPELKRAAFDAWDQDLGAIPPWPPQDEPPKIAPLKRKPERITREDLMPESPRRPAKPAKPSVRMPAMPERPERPLKPTKPESL